MAIISSHTLDGTNGTHAGGIPVHLVNTSQKITIFTTEMDAVGRLSETIDLSAADPADRYELVFETGAYWGRKAASEHRTVDEIVIRFSMPDRNARYHMPVILNPHSYSTWLSIPE